MKDTGDVWFRLGELIEQARGALPGSEGSGGSLRRRGRKAVSSLKKKARKSSKRSAPVSAIRALLDRDGDTLQGLLGSPLGGLAAAGTGTVGLRLAQRFTDQRRPPVAALIGAAAAGAAAGLLRELVLTALHQDEEALEDGLVEAVLSGAGEGLVYAAILEPFLPDSALVQGTVLGAAGYAAAPFGGVGGVLRPIAPHRSIPLVGRLLDGAGHREDRSFVEHLGYGLTLAVLYRALARRSRSGTDDDT